jgi:hypothetical protein
MRHFHHPRGGHGAAQKALYGPREIESHPGGVGGNTQDRPAQSPDFPLSPCHLEGDNIGEETRDRSDREASRDALGHDGPGFIKPLTRSPHHANHKCADEAHDRHGSEQSAGVRHRDGNSVGRKWDCPKSACYVRKRGEVYAWVEPIGLESLIDFTLTMAKLSSLIKETQTLISPGSVKFSPGDRGG